MDKTIFDYLKFTKITSSGFRAFPIKEVMPVNPDLNNYFAVLTEAYLVSDDSIPIRNFDQLFLNLGLEKTEKNLADIRAKGLIYEGEKSFPPSLYELFNNISDYIYIRSAESGKIWKHKVSTFFCSENIFSLVTEDYGEFDVTDDKNNWYCIVRDDDPIVFFSVNDKISHGLKTKTKKWAIQLNPDFNYS